MQVALDGLACVVHDVKDCEELSYTEVVEVDAVTGRLSLKSFNFNHFKTHMLRCFNPHAIAMNCQLLSRPLLMCRISSSVWHGNPLPDP